MKQSLIFIALILCAIAKHHGHHNHQHYENEQGDQDFACSSAVKELMDQTPECSYYGDSYDTCGCTIEITKFLMRSVDQCGINVDSLYESIQPQCNDCPDLCELFEEGPFDGEQYHQIPMIAGMGAASLLLVLIAFAGVRVCRALRGNNSDHAVEMTGFDAMTPVSNFGYSAHDPNAVATPGYTTTNVQPVYLSTNVLQ
eukprot:TRINITY_DN12247_c0_g1_i1.p1 TRINITY_DN12247_c0_g1~~TRINITY_DN12247_c0_g1_i1.p1  ORF type:complete len:199 (-),score=39.40 TRINITY_DN12247_c0_g1_i1:30-626(-)